MLWLYDDNEYKLIVPIVNQEKIINEVHKFLGHVGIEKTKNALKREYFWPTMNQDIVKVINECQFCAKHKF